MSAIMFDGVITLHFLILDHCAASTAGKVVCSPLLKALVPSPEFFILRDRVSPGGRGPAVLLSFHRT